jgi:peptide/nickel transport system ATP-binding protein/oligopeptide transport system ATP-binding protein
MTELLRVEGLRTVFRTAMGQVAAVDGVSLSVDRGKTLGIVGESGCGKSMLSLSIMRLVPQPGRIADGRILFDGQDLLQLKPDAMRNMRGRRIGMIFQEPMTSLNPVFSVGDQITEAMRAHDKKASNAELRIRAIAALDRVRIPSASRRLDEYPHQMSGGMRQRVMIAMALACNPALLIADEPTTALDVTVQAQVLKLMRRLQDELGMGILFITHNLGVVAEVAQNVAVMYAGKVLEQGDVVEIFHRPKHPYTRSLLASLPRLESRTAGQRHRLAAIPGSVPSPRDLPPGCPFAPRCAHREDACDAAMPELEECGPTHHTRCLRWRNLA